MKKEKVIVDGKEIEVVTEIDKEEVELHLVEQEDLEDTLELNDVVEEIEEGNENE